MRTITITTDPTEEQIDQITDAMIANQHIKVVYNG